MEVTAEGIETPEQLATLRALKCHRGQGYYFARPLAADAAGEMLSRNAHSIDARLPAAA